MVQTILALRETRRRQHACLRCARGRDLPRTRAAAAEAAERSHGDRAAARHSGRAPPGRPRPRRERRRLPRRGHAQRAEARRGPRGGHARDPHRRPRGCAPAVRLRRRRRARAVRALALRRRGRAEGGAGDRLGLVSCGAPPRDRARGHGTLRGDPRDRQEDGAAGRARAEDKIVRRVALPEVRHDGHLVARDALVELGWTRSSTPSGRSPRSIRSCRPRSACARRSGRRHDGSRGRDTVPGACAAGTRRTTSTARCGRRHLDEFVGQERLKAQLEVALTAAITRGEALDHVLLVGPPGLGKTASRTSFARSSASASAPSQGLRSSGRATWRRSSRRSTRATCCSSTRSTG